MQGSHSSVTSEFKDFQGPLASTFLGPF